MSRFFKTAETLEYCFFKINESNDILNKDSWTFILFSLNFASHSKKINLPTWTTEVTIITEKRDFTSSTLFVLSFLF